MNQLIKNFLLIYLLVIVNSFAAELSKEAKDVLANEMQKKEELLNKKLDDIRIIENILERSTIYKNRTAIVALPASAFGTYLVISGVINYQKIGGLLGGSLIGTGLFVDGASVYSFYLTYQQTQEIKERLQIARRQIFKQKSNLQTLKEIFENLALDSKKVLADLVAAKNKYIDDMLLQARDLKDQIENANMTAGTVKRLRIPLYLVSFIVGAAGTYKLGESFLHDPSIQKILASLFTIAGGAASAGATHFTCEFAQWQIDALNDSLSEVLSVIEQEQRDLYKLEEVLGLL